VRIILDSNVWLAILTTDGFCRQMWKKVRRDCAVIASQDILDEIEEKLRQKFEFSPRHARLMVLFVERQTHAVNVTTTIQVCRDPDDNRILAAAHDGDCSHLVTGDNDLLTLKQFNDIKIVTPREFSELISHV
jgi:putative PIN family toxin of toxin-antitoxin system